MLARLFICASLLIGGCQTQNYFSTEEAVTTDGELHSLIVEDIMRVMTKNFPPAKTRLSFAHQNEKMAQALEERLRQAGYAVDANRQGDIAIGYILDRLDTKTIALKFVAGKDIQATRLYRSERPFQAAGPLILRTVEL